MSEYIEREATLEQVERREKLLELLGLDKTLSVDSLKNFIKNRPAADVVPVVHGKWIKRGYVCGDYEWECSACHETEWRGLSGADVMRFCMFCGAKMDGGAKDEVD